MKKREKILRVVCLVLVFFVGQALAWGPPAASAESESVSPLGFEGNSNTFYGTGAGTSTVGDTSQNTFIGYRAGYSNISYQNTFVGYEAGYWSTAAAYNSFFGHHAGYTNTTGSHNSFIGYVAGLFNTTGSNNSFVGSNAGAYNTTGDNNNFFGAGAGAFNTTGYQNNFLGSRAGWSNTTGSGNSFLGAEAGYGNTEGNLNTFLGSNAGYFNTTGYNNTFVGYDSGHSNTTGFNNAFFGNSAGYTNSGNGNVFLGYNAGYNETGSNKLYIANSNTASPLIYGDFDTRIVNLNGNLRVVGPNNGLVRLTNTIADSTTKVSRMVLSHYSNAELPLYLFGAASTASANFVAFGGGNTMGNAATQLDLFTAPNRTTPVGIPRLTIIGNGNVGIGTQTPSHPLQMAGGAYSNGGSWINGSSREYKENIESLETGEALMALASLDPVKFNYKADASEKHIGFIAEEVPELVATKDRKGLSPMDIVAVLTKVVQEQQKVVQEQQRTAGNQQKTIDEQQTLIHTLTAKLAQLEAKLEALQK